MRSLLLFLTSVFLFVMGCSPKVGVVSATVQKWVGGAKGSGGGMNYEVKISKSTKNAVRIDSVWAGNSEIGVVLAVTVFNAKNNSTLAHSTAPKGVTEFLLRFSKMWWPKGSPHSEKTPGQPRKTPPITLPEGFTDGCIIWYSEDGRAKPPLVVKDIKKLERLDLP